MNCPRCAAPLAKGQPRPGVEVDRCSGCGGAWLDKSEVYHFSGDPEALRRRLAEAYKKPSLSGLKCPSCSVELARVIAGSVELEACPKCGGNWFDSLELELLTQKADAPRPEASSHGDYSGPVGREGVPVSSAAVDPKADWIIAPNPRPASETFGLISAVLAACAALAVLAAVVLKKAFPQLF